MKLIVLTFIDKKSIFMKSIYLHSVPPLPPPFSAGVGGGVGVHEPQKRGCLTGSQDLNL